MTLYKSIRKVIVGDGETVYPIGTVFSFDDHLRAEKAVKSGLVEEIEIITVEDRQDENTAENTDINNLKVEELKDLADQRGLEYPASIKKAELIELING